jgi:hypothetical protein
VRNKRIQEPVSRAWLKRLVAAVIVVGLTMVGSQAITQARHGDRPGRPQVNGVVEVGGQPAAGWQVELYAAGRDGARLMDTTSSNADG